MTASAVMNRIRRTCRSLGRLAGPPGPSEPRESQLKGPQARRAGRSGRYGIARRLIQDMAAAASAEAGHQAGWQGHENQPAGGHHALVSPPRPDAPSAQPAGQHRPATTAATSRRRTMIGPGLPHTVQLCIHCRESPAGFWVSHNSGKTVRRPWCLSCCQALDQDRYDVIPFDG